MDPVVLGGRVRELRQKRKLTQVQLADKARVAPNTVRGLEKGTMQTRREVYERIVAALETTPALLEQTTTPISDEHPLLAGLNDDDLRIAQAYSRARTPTRLRIERLLLGGGPDPGLDLLERIEGLDPKRKDRLVQSLALDEKAGAAEREAQKSKEKSKKPVKS